MTNRSTYSRYECSNNDMHTMAASDSLTSRNLPTNSSTNRSRAAARLKLLLCVSNVCLKVALVKQ